MSNPIDPISAINAKSKSPELASTAYGNKPPQQQADTAVNSAINQQIKECLAYKVLRDPEDFLGAPSSQNLHAFLLGAELRAACTTYGFPHWRIYGAMENPEFYQPLVDMTGHPKLAIKWSQAIAMTHFSEIDGFHYLCERAIDWHFKHGADTQQTIPMWQSDNKLDPTRKRAEHFWRSFGQRPHKFLGKVTSWTLLCFFNGMDLGGEWLKLPEMPHLRLYFDRIMKRSEESYGSTFAAFRIYSARTLLEWAGLSGGK